MTDTRTILTHLGRDHTGFASVNPPTYRGSTILFDDFDTFSDAYYGRAALAYGRQGNPTVHGLADAISQLINADYTLLTPSGLLAITTPLLAFLAQGDHVLMIDSAYGPTHNFCEHVLKRMGVETTYYAPSSTADELEAMVRNNTKVIFLEAPGSMTFEMQDIREICTMAKRHNCITMIDYTWATPLYMQPFDLGIDIAIQAVTKYIGGHSDIIMGATSCQNPAYRQRIAATSAQLGNYVSSDECQLALRGLRTMQVRLEQQTKHASAVMEWLAEQPEISHILSPAHPDSPDHKLWQEQLTGACSLFGVVMRDGFTLDQMRAVTNALTLFGRGFSWGGYESLIIPFKPAEIRKAPHHWSRDTWSIRFHIGLESPQDLIADLQQAFSVIR